MMDRKKYIQMQKKAVGILAERMPKADAVAMVSVMDADAIQKILTPSESERLEIVRPESVEIVGADAVGVLPDSVPALIDDFIYSYCENNGIEDLKKERQASWAALCMAVGRSLFKGSKILHDMERERQKGTTVYSVGRVSELVDVWAFLCLKYNKTPFIDDFAHFSGVSDTWLYGAATRDTLTPERSALLKKIQKIQESGLSASIADGRQNPTGALACLNHWHGWTQSREIIHTSGADAVRPAIYPTFERLPETTTGADADL